MTASSSTTVREAAFGSSQITVRKPELDFERPIERFYLHKNPIKSHVFNALNLMFPEGERFFVKAVHDHLKDLGDDAALQRDARAFAGQEGQHAHHHERFFEVLERQGYDTGRILRPFLWLYRRSRVLPRALRLSITAGAEHYTASMAALVFEQDIVDDCDPTMRDLIRWHALEEIEHKHVAYDVYARMHPYNYPLRILGFLLASVVIMGFTGRGMRMLLSADALAGRITREQFAAARREMREGKALAFRKAMLPALLKYFVPGFHPNQQDDSALLARVAPEIALTTSTR